MLDCLQIAFEEMRFFPAKNLFQRLVLICQTHIGNGACIRIDAHRYSGIVNLGAAMVMNRIENMGLHIAGRANFQVDVLFFQVCQ